MTDRTYQQDAEVIYVDPTGKGHKARVTTWWGQGSDYPQGRHEPGCNVAYGDPPTSATSVVHKSSQSAPANYWVWPDEAPPGLMPGGTPAPVPTGSPRP